MKPARTPNVALQGYPYKSPQFHRIWKHFALNSPLTHPNMPPSWYCPVCRRTFASSTHFMGHHRTRRNEACHQFYQNNHSTHPTGMHDPNNAGQIRFQVDPNPVQGAPLVGHIPLSSSSEDISDASMDDSGQEEGNDGFPVPDDDDFVPLYQPEQTEREPNTTMRALFNKRNPALHVAVTPATSMRA